MTSHLLTFYGESTLETFPQDCQKVVLILHTEFYL